MKQITKSHHCRTGEYTGGTRGYNSPADRKRAIRMLQRRGWNHFTCYRDVQSRYALQYGKSDFGPCINW